MTFTTSDNNFGVAKWIVDPVLGQGTHQTIGAALTAASSGQTIFIRPGTYTENLTLKAGVNLTSFETESGGSINFGTDTPHVKIVGKATATFAGTATISGIWFETNSDFVLVISGAAATTVSFKNCFFNGANNSLISGTSSGGAFIDLLNCYGNLATTGINYFALSNGCGMNLFYTKLFNGGASTTANTVANGGAINLYYCTLNNPTTTSDTAALAAVWCEFLQTNATALTINGTGSSYIYHCRVESGTASAISVGAGATLPIYSATVDSTNTNAITGLGTVKIDNVIFTNTSSTINTSTVSSGVHQLSGTAKIDSSGRSTNTGQPAFFAYKSSNSTNQTGDGTVATVVFDSTTKNVGTSYATGTGIFTAPVTGLYHFTTSVSTNPATATYSDYILFWNSSTLGLTRAIQWDAGVTMATVPTIQTASISIQMTANDTLSVQVAYFGATKIVTVAGSALPSHTTFSGFLVC